jgi:DNA replication protein DnaC
VVKFPRLKRLADFNVDAVPTITPSTLGHLAAGHYMAAGEPVVLLGDSGTGKSHYADLRVMPTWRTKPLQGLWI